MSNIPTEDENPEGLHQRYRVLKTDGSEVDPRAEYFVLRLDKNGNDPRHIKACREAILTYAREIEKWIPKLSEDLISRYS